MKKFLSFLGSISLISSMATTVVACGNSDADFHRNPDYEGEESKQSAETKELIIQSMEARIKAAIITDNYKINSEQSKDLVFQTLSKNDTNLSKIYTTYFEESDFNRQNSGIDKTIDLEGNRGYPGGLFDLIKLPEFLDFILKQFLNIDIHTPVFKKQIIELLELVSGVLPGFEMGTFLDEVPGLLLKIPTDFLDVIPKILQPGIPDAIQAAINTFIDRNMFNDVLNGMIQGSDLTRFESLTTSQLFDALFVNLTNFVGFGIDDSFTKISDTENVDYDQLGTFWFNQKQNLNQFDFKRNLNQTVEQLISLIGVLNLILSIYKTPSVSYLDNTHLFSDTQTNEEMVLELQSKTVKELLDPNFNFKDFQMGSLISNLVYFFGSGPNEQFRFNKFLYLALFNGDLENLPAFWKFNFALIKADENSENGKVAKGISAKLNDLYLQTIGPKLLQPILNNQNVNPIVEEENQAYKEIIDQDIAKGIKPFFESITSTLATKPIDVVYTGNLNPIIDSTANLAGEEWTKDFQAKINNLLKGKPLNAKNLLEVNFSQVLGLLGVAGFPTNDQGLVPDYAGYYTTKSLRGLVDELGTTFEMKGSETQTELLYYTMNFGATKGFFEYLLYDNKVNENQGLVADFFEALIAKDLSKLAHLLGYVDNHLDQVKKDSVLGQLMLFMVPQLSIIEEPIFNYAADLKGKQDNFKWVINGIMSVITNVMQPTNYNDFVKQLLAIENVFTVEKNIEEFKNNGNISSGQYIITYDLEVANAALGQPKPNTNIKKITYRLSFAATSETGNYQIKTFRKR